MNMRVLEKKLKYMVPEVRLALIREPGVEAQAVRCPEDVEKFVEPLKHFSEEHFVSFHLDAKSNVIGYHVVSHGTVSASLVHPREVFKAAILNNSMAVLVAHNHPAGSREPSEDDLKITRTLVQAGQLMCVTVIDHVIVTARGIYSLREHYPALWD
jgi:DNA repair protein RadC